MNTHTRTHITLIAQSDLVHMSQHNSLSLPDIVVHGSKYSLAPTYGSVL